MNIVKKWLFGNKKNIMRSSAVWNLISSVEYSLQSAILMLVITRVNGLYDAGVFTIAYTMTQMMSTIGSYGMRSFQASDVKKEYAFGTYLSSRLISVFAMIVICMAYAMFQGYGGEKLIIIILLCGYRTLEVIEDVFHGEMQKNMRLDIASKIEAVRIFAATAAFGLCYIVTCNLILSSVVLTVTAAVFIVILNIIVSEDFKDITLRISKSGVIRLLWVCLPICIGGFLYNYLVNAPKYSIDRNLSEEEQTIFSILFMPIFVINMLSSFVFKPMIVTMGILWSEKKYKKFIAIVGKQMLIIAGLTIVCVGAGALAGTEILGLLYGVALDEYRILFTLLVAFGGLAAIVSFLVVILTIIRQQKYIIVAYGVGVITDWLFIDKMVREHELWGAGMIYGAAMAVITLVMAVVVMAEMHRRKREEKHELVE